MHNTIERTPEEVSEIERHKYFLSEKAGHDVGWEYAANDWEQNHSQTFRKDDPGPGTPGIPNGHAKNGISMLFKRLFSRS